MLQVAEMIIQNGFVKLKTAFKTAFPTVKNYNQQYACRRLLQIPLICLRIDHCPGISECILTEFIPSVDYKAFAGLLSSIIQQQERKFKQPVCYLDKSLLGGLLKICESDREREIIWYSCKKFTIIFNTSIQTAWVSKYGSGDCQSR